jgi:hypothetical protein
MVGAAAHYVHGAQAAGEVAEELREAIKEMVAFNVLPATLWALRWTDAGFPTILNTEILRAEDPGRGEDGTPPGRQFCTDASRGG